MKDLNNRNDRVAGIVPFSTFCALIMVAFVYCYFGNRVTDKPIQFAQSAYETPWYSLPVKRQRGICLMIVYGKYEIYYTGYGILTCSLETFGNVSP